MTGAPHVQLRSLRADDRGRLLEWRNLPDVARWMYSDHVISADEHRAWFERALADASRRYWIIEVDGRPVGLVNLYDISSKDRRATWAYYIAEGDVRGRGVGAFIEYWIIEHALGELGLEKLWCEVLAGNEAVWKLHESFGFQREAYFRRHVLKGGAWLDVIGLGLLASDWAERREASRARLIQKGFNLSRPPMPAA